jgi:FMN phosphatase YigB (HAD superfamily)
MVILFDLGNTLISYYSRNEFQDILRDAIGKCAEYLKRLDEIIDELEDPKTCQQNH